MFSGMCSMRKGGSKHRGARWKSHWLGRRMGEDMILGEVMPTDIPRTVWMNSGEQLGLDHRERNFRRVNWRIDSD